jgi:acyl-coenzyme A synthetase/AMP-(fatty) acid ligase
VPSPFAPGERLYRTGDRARARGDGRLEFLGRLDTQIKLGGFRIELGEIEAALTRHALVREAVVIVRGERLIAYVTPALDDGVCAQVERLLRAELPPYMVPSAIVGLDALPLTPNGKVDVAALSARAAALPAPRRRPGR